MAKPLIATVLVPIYRSRLALLVCDDDERLILHAKRFYGRKISEEEMSHAFSLSGQGRVSLCLRRGKFSHDCLGHEIFHNTARIMYWHGVQFDGNNHEAHAYLNGWLHGWVYRKLHRAREKIKV